MDTAALPHKSLDLDIVNRKLSTLNLSESTLVRLAELDLHTMADIHDLQVEGLTLVGLDEVTAEHVWSEVLDYVSTPARWKQACFLEQLIVRRENLPYLDDELLDLPGFLPEYIRLIFEHTKDIRLYDILVRRHGLNGSDKYTLEEVAAFYEITRERIRQLENKAKGILKAALCEGVAPVKHVLINDEIVNAVLVLRQEIEQRYSIILREEFVEHIQSRYSKEKIGQNEMRHLELLMVMWNWTEQTSLPRLVYQGDIRPFWILPDTNIDLERIAQSLKQIQSVLCKEAVRVSYFDLKVQVNRRTKTHFNDFEIRTAIQISQDIEVLEDDAIQVKFHRLRNAGEQAYRILFEAGTPLSFRVIHKEMAARLARGGEQVVSQNSLVNAMTSDERMGAIAKSGQWALVEWEDINQKCIVPLMQEFFHKHGKPAKAKDVYEYVSERRPVKYNSINAYLVDVESFVRIAPGLYQLADWPLPSGTTSINSPRTKQLTWNKLAVLILQVFDEAGTEKLPISDLVRRLQELTGRGQISYRSLQDSPAIEIKVLVENPRRLEAKVIRNYLELPAAQQRQFTMRERVYATVRSILSRQSDKSMQLTLLKEEVVRKTGVNGHTFYSYLSEMIDVQKARIPDTPTYMCILIQDQQGDKDVEIEMVQELWDSDFMFDLAISYAGKEVHITREFADAFQSQGFSCFFDREQLPDLVGRNLNDDLTEIYENKAHLCLLLASQAYNDSIYAQIERQAAQARAVRDNGYLVVVKLEDVSIKGMPSTQAYLDYNRFEFNELIKIIVQRLRNRLQS